MKKLFFFDIDGTILDSSRGLDEVSVKTKYAFKELMKDNYVLIASGRCKALLNTNITSLKPNGYVLCNGSYAEIDGKVVFSKTFNVEEIRKIKQFVKDNNGFYIAETINNLYVEDLNDPLLIKFFKDWGTIPSKVEEKPNVEDNVHILMIGFDNEETVLKAQRDLSKVAGVDRHFWFLSHDINVKGINKGEGCKKVIESLNIRLEDTYAFGDGINDLQMMEAVGHPVIMKNASPLMKNRGFEETDDVIDDGVYNYLVRNGLLKPLEQ